ncbi:NUDIX hydrolase [Roseimaritima sediminicola]|uniref:NUDIX hydrolase n=1 Tax=Roseimaritima sediminicola TaxID=2662066 RepID=UPI001386AB82|nr:CoA pyrophosphatase [Roseimaritima sediminicola]
MSVQNRLSTDRKPFQPQTLDDAAVEQFISQLQQRLTHDLPGRRALRYRSPQLSYGRHCGPAPRTARQAAVVVMLLWSDGGWTVPLTKRPLSIKHHGGQICLPGGRIEPNESTIEAALREFEEELGICPLQPELCGELSPLYVYASDNLVHPVVMACRRPESPWVPDRIEVDEVVEVPLEHLREPGHWQDRLLQRPIRRVSGNPEIPPPLRFVASGLRYQQHWVWGATGMILAELAECLPPQS